MATLSDVEKVSLTPQHLIVEYVSGESLFSAIAPTLKVRGLKLVRTSHVQVMRYVYKLVEVEDVYFKGRKLPGMPGFGELLSEWIEPGRQIVSVPNGKIAVLHSYTGKKNILHASVAGLRDLSVPMGFIDLYGKDPAPRHVLFGNPAVPFIRMGGKERLMAAAYYNGRSHRFEVLHQFESRTLLENFQRRFARALEATG